MSKTKLTINAKTLFPAEQLKEHIKEALRIAKDLSPAIITQNNRPAFAIVRLDEAYPIPQNSSDESTPLAKQIQAAQAAAKGKLTTEPYWWEEL